MTEIRAKPERTYALVVGIEKYSETSWNVKGGGPVNDALKFADWLCSRDVPKENIWLCLSPLEENNHLVEQSDLNPEQATEHNLSKIIEDYLSQKKGDLLYIFWAGHGLLTSERGRKLLCADATFQNGHNLILDSLFLLLKSDCFQIRHHICIVEACADFLDLQKLPKNLKGKEFSSGRPRHDSQTFVLFATREGEKAKVNRQEKTGYFSQAVRDALEQESVEDWPPNMEEVAKKVVQQVTSLLGKKQQPTYHFTIGFWDGNIIESRTKYPPNWQKREIVILVIFLAVLTGLAIHEWRLRITTEKMEKSRLLAKASADNLSVDTTRSLLLAIEANLIQETPQASIALWNAFQENHERFHLAGHEGPVLYAEFDDPKNSKDSKRVLTVSSDKTARLWPLDDLAHPLVLKGHTARVTHGSFDPQNSSRLLTVSYDTTARLWDVNDLENSIVINGHKGPINYGCFDPKNYNRILTASSDNTAIVWDITNPQRSRSQAILKHDGDVWMASFDPINPNRVLTVSRDGTAKIWNLNDINKPLVLKGHTGDILYGTFDPRNSNRVLTVSMDKTAGVWDLNRPNNPLFLKGHEGTVTMASFSPNNSNRVLTVSQDSTARIWNLKNPTQPIVLKGHSREILYGAFNPQNPEQVLTVSADNRAILWDIPGTKIVQSFNGHQQRINLATFNPKNPNQILTVSDDSTGKIWEISSNKALFDLPKKQGPIVQITFSLQNSNQILTIDRSGLVKTWDIFNKSYQNNYQLKTEIDSIISADFNPNDPYKIATVNVKGIIQIWNLQNSLQPILELPKGNDNAVTVKFDSKNPENIFIVNENGAATIRNIKKPNEEPVVLSVPPNRISYGQFDPNNSDRIITASDDGFVRIWSIKNPSEPLLEKSTYQPLWYASFDPQNSQRILAGGSDKIVRVWNLQSNEKPTELKGHQAEVVYGGFDPNNSNRILTASNDETVRLWDVTIPNEPIIIKNFGAELIYSSFDPKDSNRLIALTRDSQVKIYVTRGKKLLEYAWKNLSRCLTPDELTHYNLENTNIVNSLSNYLNLSEQALLQPKYRLNCQQNSTQPNEKSNISFFTSPTDYSSIASRLWILPGNSQSGEQK
jgi:WD40 repeat protein